jgi:hypothetical protein
MDYLHVFCTFIKMHTRIFIFFYFDCCSLYVKYDFKHARVCLFADFSSFAQQSPSPALSQSSADSISMPAAGDRGDFSSSAQLTKLMVNKAHQQIQQLQLELQMKHAECEEVRQSSLQWEQFAKEQLDKVAMGEQLQKQAVSVCDVCM